MGAKMQRRVFAMVTALVLVSGVALVGVAGASVAGKPLSEQQWRKAANSVCAKTNPLLAEAANTAFASVPSDQQPSIEQMSAYVAAIKPILQQQIDSIDALKEPTTLQAKVKKLLKTAQRELDALVADPNRGFDGNPFSATILLSNKLKLKDCAS
jgi:hypothetical protein